MLVKCSWQNYSMPTLIGFNHEPAGSLCEAEDKSLVCEREKIADSLLVNLAISQPTSRSMNLAEGGTGHYGTGDGRC